MEKCRLTDKLISDVKAYIKSGFDYDTSKTKVRRWYNKWTPILFEGNLFVNEKPLISESQVNSYLEHAVKQGMPLGKESAYKWLVARAYGFKKKVIYNYIQSIESVQLLKKRPFKNYRRNLTQTSEGDAQVLLNQRFGGHTTVGIDLVFLPRQTKNYPREAWTRYKYVYVAVVQANNYLFAYPMTRKTAVEARRCARLLIADFKKRYGLRISTIVMDAGTEFQKEHKAYLSQNDIKQLIVSKVWFVERKNSQLMRQIAFLREGIGYKWEHSFKNAILKVNQTYCRKIKKTPEEVTGVELKEGLKHYNRKLKLNPRAKAQPVFKLKDRVRHLLKSAMDVNTVMWKSYNAFRAKKTGIWSKTVYPVAGKRKKGRIYQYFVNERWFFPYQLQLIKGSVIQIQAEKPVAKPKPQKKVAKKKKVAQVELRRGTRVRKKTTFYGR